MRLHTLELTAFGPFPGTETISFDDFDDAGILLIHGPTGAGKTSLLDAVAFALFGEVPGARRGQRSTLRSHHAAPGARPLVVIEFSVGTTRWRIERSPTWEAPKRHGCGTTTRHASVSVARRAAASLTTDWEPVTNRIPEAADLITDLLGMKLDQFAQVVLLPQGEFAQFLRAKPEDRRELLERLFDVSRFDHIENWLVDYKNSLAREVESVRTQLTTRTTMIGEILERLDGVQGAPDFEELEPSQVPDALRTVLRQVRHGRDASADEARSTARELRCAERSVDSARSIVRERARFAQAVTTLEAHPARELRQMRQRLDRAGSANAVVRLHERAQSATDQAAKRALDEASAKECFAAALGVRSQQGWREQAEADVDSLKRAIEHLGRVSAERDLVTGAQRSVQDAQAKAQQAQTSLDDAGAHLEHATAELRSAAVQREATPDPDVLACAVTAWTAAKVATTQARNRLTTLQVSEKEARAQYLQAEEAELTLRQHRLNNLAAALSQDLVAGRACPVCGSCDHPAPAQPSADADISPQAVRAAQKQVEQTRQAHATLAQRLAVAQQGAQDAEASESEAHSALWKEARLVQQSFLSKEAGVTPISTQTSPTANGTSQLTSALADARDVLTSALTAPKHTSRTENDTAGSPRTDREPDVALATTVADKTTVPDNEPDWSVVVARLRLAHAEVLAHHERCEAAVRRASEAEQRAKIQTAQQQVALEATRERLASAIQRHDEALAELETLLDDTALNRAVFDGAAFDSPAFDSAAFESPGTEGTGTVGTFIESLALAGSGLTTPQDQSEQHKAVTVWLTAQLQHVRALLRAGDELSDAVRAHREAERVRQQAQTDLDDQLVATGFDDAQAALDEALDPQELTQLRDYWSELHRQRVAAEEVVGDPDLIAAAFTPEPKPDVLADRCAVLARQHEHAQSEAARWKASFSDLDAMRHTVADLVAAFVPKAQRAKEIGDLAATFSGSGENTHRMRLTSYVLASYLEDITALANQRLARMGDGRYQLRHSDQRAARGALSGLGLVVLDSWTGHVRDTATLSGGEAFMASLALALGLGDAVRAESGGIALHTLFVDEGFGSLDPDTLEDVMGILDELRSGGRLVGIVSHVSELKDRIPARIEVVKTSEGSTIRQRSTAKKLDTTARD